MYSEISLKELLMNVGKKVYNHDLEMNIWHLQMNMKMSIWKMLISDTVIDFISSSRGLKQNLSLKIIT